MTKLNWFNKVLSYVLPVKIEEAESPQNGHLELLLYNGRIILNSQHANYSFDSLHRVFRQALWHVGIEEKKNLEHVLILGFGIGSIAHILREEMHLDCKIIGVEHDPIILKWAKDYFSYSRDKDIEIADFEANEFINTSKDSFDLICVDLFKDTEIPEFLFEEQTVRRLRSLLKKNGSLIVNTMLSEEEAERLLETYRKELPEAYLKKFSEGNRVLFFVEEGVQS